MATTPNFERNDSATLSAKLHQGYDPGIEHKEQGNLYSAVQFNQHHSQEMPILAQIVGGFAGALRSVADGVSNLFSGNNFNAGDHNGVPQLPDVNGPQIEMGGAHLAPLADFGAFAEFRVPVAAANSGISAGQDAPIVTNSAGAQVSLVVGGEPNQPIIPDNPPVPPPSDGPSTPIIAALPVLGSEDTPVLLNIGLTSDPLGVTSVLISGVPNGAILSVGVDNHDGSWTLTPAQLTGLTLTPPHNASGAFVLEVTAVTVENNQDASATQNVSVTIGGVADTPIVSVQNSSGNEDATIPLTISAALTDTDGSETLSIVIGNMPVGATLSAGIDNHNGTWTLTPAQLVGLTFTPPLHTSGNFDLSVTAISSENNTTASANTDLHVNVSGTAQAPILSVTSSTGDEDTAIALHINASLLVNDGSVLSVVIGNVPNGAMLSAGIDNHNGTWTLTEAQLTNLTITPPHNSDAAINLSVSAIDSNNGHSAITNDPLHVTVEGVADTPNLSVTAASGNEDTPIALNISAALTDTDGSETLSLVISNVPNGAILSAGINNHDGTWSLTPAQLTGLTITPPEHFSGTIGLSVAAIASENNNSATATAPLNVTVNGEATTPSLTVTAASGNEDTPIALNINAALVDTDGSETLAITIAGVPVDAVLSAGVDNHNGTWSLTSAQLSGLTIIPPHNSDADFTLSVTATSSENGTTASIHADLPVTVVGVADLPTLSVSAASGNENTAIALNIAAALTDTDGSEALAVTITGVPDGAVLSAGSYDGNGHWTLTAAQLVGLTITPPRDYNGPINLSVVATSTEDDGDTASTGATTLSVTVDPVVHIPTVTVGVAVGNEDTPIALGITIAPHVGDTVSVLISGVPTGATLSAGIDNHNGTWTLTDAQLANLTITPPHNSDADFDLSVTATATASDGTMATANSPLQVIVHAVADVPNVSAADVSGAINTHIPLNISGSLNDTDGSESITYVIAGVPDGFAFNHGSNDGNNNWTFTPSDLAGLTLTTPYQFHGTLSLVAYSVSHEAESGAIVALSAGDAFNVTVGDPSLGINLNLSLGLGALGIGDGTGIGVGVDVSNILDPGGLVLQEDSPLLLNGLSGLLTTVLTPLQQLGLANVIISGLPVGVTLSDGINLGNGSYQLTSGQLGNLYLISPPNSDQDFTLSIDAKLLSLISINLATTVVHVIGVADAPLLSVSNANAVEGSASIPLHITSALTDTDGSETLSITLSNLPSGFIANIGINNTDGTWTIPVAQLASLALIAPAHWSGDATYTVTATSTEREGDSTNTVVTGHIHVDPIADAPIVAPPAASGSEGQPVNLNLGISLTDNDGSEHLSSIVIGGMATGFSLNHGTDNHDGTWNVDPSDITHLQLITPAHWSGDAHLTVTATTQEGLTGLQASVTTSLVAHVEAHADTPALSVQNESGNDASPIALHINAGLADTDGSEHLSVVISGMQSDMTLTAGLHNQDGTWTLSQSDLAHVALNTNVNYSGDLHLTAKAVAQEQSNGDTATASQNFTVHVDHTATTDHAFHG
jgi:hypothetical protein